MSTSELVVVVFGLFIGYWVVTKFSGGPSIPRQARPEAGPESARETSRNDPPSANWHEVLQISPHADEQEIRRAYKSLISQYHPDKVAALGPELREVCERKSKEINLAYDQAIKARGVAAS